MAEYNYVRHGNGSRPVLGGEQNTIGNIDNLNHSSVSTFIDWSDRWKGTTLCSNIPISVARGHPTRNRTGDSPRIHVSETSETKYHQPTRSLPAFSHVHLRTYNIRPQHPDKPSQRVNISAHYFARGPRTRAHLIPRRRCDGTEDSRRNHHFRQNYKSR